MVDVEKKEPSLRVRRPQFTSGVLPPTDIDDIRVERPRVELKPRQIGSGTFRVWIDDRDHRRSVYVLVDQLPHIVVGTSCSKEGYS